MQQANKVEQGIIVGVRPVAVSASGTVGTVAGGAAGGIAGAQVGTGAVSALSALGGTLVGGLAGSAAEHVAGDTDAFEYIVRKKTGDLVSVTQKDKTPLSLGLKVLVIAGAQARVVPDYTNPELAEAPAAKRSAPSSSSTAPVVPPAVDATPLAPVETPTAGSPQAPPPLAATPSADPAPATPSAPATPPSVPARAESGQTSI